MFWVIMSIRGHSGLLSENDLLLVVATYKNYDYSLNGYTINRRMKRKRCNYIKAMSGHPV